MTVIYVMVTLVTEVKNMTLDQFRKLQANRKAKAGLVAVNVDIPATLRDRVKACCAIQRKTQAEAIVEALSAWIDDNAHDVVHGRSAK